MQTLPYEQLRKSKRHGVPEIVRGFKTYSSCRINELRKTKGTPVWQRSFYDRIIRNEEELNRIREYILYNPARWRNDEHYE